MLNILVPRNNAQAVELCSADAAVVLKGAGTDIMDRVHGGYLAPQGVVQLQGLEGLPLSLRRVVETLERAGDTQRQTVEFDLKVEGAAQGALGPTLLRAGSLERRVDAMPFTLLAPEGHQPALLPPLGEQLRVPSTQFSGLPERGGARQGDWLLVRGLPGDQVRWLGEPTRVYSVEVREGNNPSWVGWGAWGSSLGAVLLRQGAELWRIDP